MDVVKIQCTYKYCEFYSNFKVHIIRFKSSELFGSMESNSNCKTESFLHFSGWSEYRKRPYLFKQTVLTWGVFPCDLVHLPLNWRTRDLCSTTSRALHSTVTPCHCAFFFSVSRCSDTWVFLELGKKGKMEEHGKLRLLSILRDFIHPWVCLVLMLPFRFYWGLKWFKELQANKEFLVKAGVLACFLFYLEVLQVNRAGDIIIGWSGMSYFAFSFWSLSTLHI